QSDQSGEAHEGLSAAPEPEDRSAVFYGLPSGIRRTSEAERTSPTDGASGSDRRLAHVTCDATCRSSAERNTRFPRPPANGSAETPARWPEVEETGCCAPRSISGKRFGRDAGTLASPSRS